jgi:hypothetical protein
MSDVITRLYNAFDSIDLNGASDAVDRRPSPVIIMRNNCEVLATELTQGIKEITVKLYGDDGGNATVSVVASTREVAERTWHTVVASVQLRDWLPNSTTVG